MIAMPDFVVDLDISVIEPYDNQLSVAVSARDRDDAAAVAMLIASDMLFETDHGQRYPYEVYCRAVENGIEDGFDQDWRGFVVKRATEH
jgi:hypothetical protein